MMRVYLMRHGYAQDAVPPIDNFHRALTPTGIAETKRMGRWLAQCVGDGRLGIYYSPPVRTRQTAELVRDECRIGGTDVREVQALYALLRPDWAPLRAHLLDAARRGLTDILMVSHHPYLQKWLREEADFAVKYRQSAVTELCGDEWGALRPVRYVRPDDKEIVGV